ncbi:MAG: hypothetical protein AAB649_00280 [Patescibacteria group bacterium]
MGLTRQEKQDRLWDRAIKIRDEANKERAFNDMLGACHDAYKFIRKLRKMGVLEGTSNDGLNWDTMYNLKYAIQEAEGTIK